MSGEIDWKGMGGPMNFLGKLLRVALGAALVLLLLLCRLAAGALAEPA